MEIYYSLGTKFCSSFKFLGKGDENAQKCSRTGLPIWDTIVILECVCHISMSASFLFTINVALIFLLRQFTFETFGGKQQSLKVNRIICLKTNGVAMVRGWAHARLSVALAREEDALRSGEERRRGHRWRREGAGTSVHTSQPQIKTKK